MHPRFRSGLASSAPDEARLARAKRNQTQSGEASPHSKLAHPPPPPPRPPASMLYALPPEAISSLTESPRSSGRESNHAVALRRRLPPVFAPAPSARRRPRQGRQMP